MTLKQFWSILRGQRTNFSWMNASWTYYPETRPHWAEEISQEIRMLRAYNAHLIDGLARIAHSDAQCGEDAKGMRNIATAILHPDKAGQYDATQPTYRR